jgi:hypothetical protein
METPGIRNRADDRKNKRKTRYSNENNEGGQE